MVTANHLRHACQPKLSGWAIRALIKRVYQRPMVTLEELHISPQNLLVGQLLVVHFSNLAFMEVWQEENHYWKKCLKIPFAVYHEHVRDIANVWKVLWSDETKASCV
ncbi:hypothetical protein ILYODFUR_000758 [Ilyodon furcidens]|uniref:Uncharacterized protein n=1 Tax=Ilyodon furcidens TaxID=33524 RepID=A0ABV0UE92_9TELE